MTSSRLSLLLVVLSGLLLAGCPTDGNRGSFDYLRSPITFAVDPVADDHPFCNDDFRPAELTRETCLTTRKYRMRWERPEDTVSFQEYRVYIDTTPASAPGTPWNEVRKERQYATFVMPGRPAIADSIIFYLASTPQGDPRTLERGSPRLVALDTTGRTDASGRLVFAITTAYTESGLDGQPRYSFIVTDDRFAPYPLLPAFSAQARGLRVSWARPLDRTSFFDPKADSGVIAGYVLKLQRRNLASANPNFEPTVTYRMGNLDRSAQTTSLSYTRDGRPGRRFWLPDSQRVFNRLGPHVLDSLYVTVGNLTPRDTITVTLWAVDLSGNFIVSDTGAGVDLFLTDTTQPSTPTLSLVPGSVGRNGFAYTFLASSDSIESGGTLIQSPAPNANILEYRITRRRVGGPAGERVIDSVLQVEERLRGNTSFTDTVRYLPPGATYVVYVQAVDSTGHLSQRDSLVVTTSSSAFTGVDSGATCPPGFIAMPEGYFYLGEAPGNAPEQDESNGAGRRLMRSYCIEPREHLANASAFRNRVTWQQAHDICRDLSPADSTHLCTEAEWERACEGTEPTAPLMYGVQSERQDPAGVRYTCNIGTGDSAMAFNAALRDPACISRDGAFDMSGNLAEWVMDPYTSTGYPGQPNDTVYPGRPHTALASTSRRGFRGSHYLNAGTSPTTLMRSARCSNRDTPSQRRLQAWNGCLDANREQIAVQYSDVTKPPRCFPLPDSLKALPITSLAPGRDTNQILILVQGRTTPVNYYLPVDTAYRNQKPGSASLTKRTLAVVTFENSVTGQTVVDTLDASELLGRSDAQQTAVLTIEASAPWSARRANGAYQIQYLYALTRSVPTAPRAYYSNKILGFRCCSKPRLP